MKIKPILVTILLLCIANLSYSQKPKHYISSVDFLEGYDTRAIFTTHWIDSVTVISMASYMSTPVTVGYKIYITHIDYEMRSFKTIELKAPDLYPFDLPIQNAIKLNGKIYVPRPDKSNKIIRYYLDEVNESNATMDISTVPFFEGSVEDGFTKSFDFEQMGDHILLTSKDVDLSGHFHHLAFAYFDPDSFSLLSYYSHAISKKNKVTRSNMYNTSLKMDKFGDKKFFLYHYQDRKTKNHKSFLLYLHDSQLDSLKVDEKLSQAIFFTKNESYFIHTLKSEESGLTNSMYKINIKEWKLEHLNSGEIPLAMVNRDYESDKRKPEVPLRVKTADFNLKYEFVDDENPEIQYLVIYGMINYKNGDILIVKLNRGRIEWNQFIKRTYRLGYYYTPGINELDGVYLTIKNFETKETFDSEGNFKPEHVYFDSKDVIHITYILDTSTGEFRRVLVSR